MRTPEVHIYRTEPGFFSPCGFPNMPNIADGIFLIEQSLPLRLGSIEIKVGDSASSSIGLVAGYADHLRGQVSPVDGTIAS